MVEWYWHFGITCMSRDQSLDLKVIQNSRKWRSKVEQYQIDQMVLAFSSLDLGLPNMSFMGWN